MGQMTMRGCKDLQTIAGLTRQPKAPAALAEDT